MSDYVSQLWDNWSHIYIPCGTIHNEHKINAEMYMIIAGWLWEICHSYKYTNNTWRMCMTYMDKILCGKKIILTASNLQLVGCASLLISSKYNDSFCVSADELYYLTDNWYKADEIIEMEHKILDVLDYQVFYPTVNYYVDYFGNICNWSKHQMEYIERSFDYIFFQMSHIHPDYCDVRLMATTGACMIYPRSTDIIISLSPSYDVSAILNMEKYLCAEWNRYNLKCQVSSRLSKFVKVSPKTILITPIDIIGVYNKMKMKRSNPKPKFRTKCLPRLTSRPPVIDNIDEGTYGLIDLSVFDNKLVVVKKTKQQQLDNTGIPEDMINELSVMSVVSSRYLISCDAIYDKSRYPEIIMPFYPKNLSDEIHYGLSPNKIIQYTTHILKGLQYLHKLGIVHADLKPCHYVINGNRLVLIDYGISKWVSPPYTLFQPTGTLPYRAIEHLTGKSPIRPATDLWNVGCIIGEMIMGFPIFSDSRRPIDNIDAIHYVLGKSSTRNTEFFKCPPKFWTIAGKIDPWLAYIMKYCLRINPDQRKSAHDLLQTKKILSESHKTVTSMKQLYKDA